MKSSTILCKKLRIPQYIVFVKVIPSLNCFAGAKIT